MLPAGQAAPREIESRLFLAATAQISFGRRSNRRLPLVTVLRACRARHQIRNSVTAALRMKKRGWSEGLGPDLKSYGIAHYRLKVRVPFAEFVAGHGLACA